MSKKNLLIVGNKGRLNDFLCKALTKGFNVDFKLSNEVALDASMQKYEVILYTGGEVRDSLLFMTENFHRPFSIFTKASELNIRFVFFSSLASLYYSDVQKYDALKDTDYRLYAESKFLCDLAISSHSYREACSIKLASINHPVRNASSFQKYISSNRLSKIALKALGPSIQYCTYDDILRAVMTVVIDTDQTSITVTSRVAFKSPLKVIFRPLLKLNVKWIPKRYYTRLYFLTMPDLGNKNPF